MITSGTLMLHATVVDRPSISSWGNGINSSCFAVVCDGCLLVVAVVDGRIVRLVARGRFANACFSRTPASTEPRTTRITALIRISRPFFAFFTTGCATATGWPQT